MNLGIQTESFNNPVSFLASHRGAMYKSGGITLSHIAKAPDPLTGKRIYPAGSFVGRINSSPSVLYGIYGEGTRARLVTALAGANNDVIWTARTVGTGGNAITIAYVNPGGNNQALSVGVVGNAITVNLATGSAGAITSTANDIINTVRASVAANALVYGELPPANNGHGVVIALGATNLAGGVSPVGQAATVGTGVVGNNNAITWTAVNIGASGNNIQIALLDPAANNALLSVNVLGSGTTGDPYVVNVSLATGAGGAITSTAASVMVAVNNHGFARTLLRGASTGASTGAGVVVAVVATALAGGANVDISMLPGEFGLLTHEVDVTNGNAIGGLMYGGKVLSARLPAAPDADVIAALPHVIFATENA
jgi:hypothetical protein